MNRRELTMNGARVTIDTWNDPAEAAQAFQPHANARSSAWHGGESTEAAQAYAVTGNAALVGDAERVLGQIQAGGLDTRGMERVAAPCGAYPIVADFLAGRPDCMRRNAPVEDDRRPLRVFVNTTSSGSIDAEALHQRGAALLALVMALTQERPVELFWVTALGGSRGNGVVVVRVPTTPLNVGVACHMLTSQAWTRGLGYGHIMEQHRADGSWFLNIQPGAMHDAMMREALGAEAHDLVVPPIFMYDALIDDPVAWVNNELERIRGSHD